MKKILVKDDAQELFEAHAELIRNLSVDKYIIQNPTILDDEEVIESLELIKKHMDALFAWKCELIDYLNSHATENEDEIKEYDKELNKIYVSEEKKLSDKSFELDDVVKIYASAMYPNDAWVETITDLHYINNDRPKIDEIINHLIIKEQKKHENKVESK